MFPRDQRLKTNKLPEPRRRKIQKLEPIQSDLATAVQLLHPFPERNHIFHLRLRIQRLERQTHPRNHFGQKRLQKKNHPRNAEHDPSFNDSGRSFG